jgi:tRNA(adenine34) deaminase
VSCSSACTAVPASATKPNNTNNFFILPPDSLTFARADVSWPSMDLLLRDDQALMREALRLAAKAAASDEVPIGAVIAKSGRIIGRGYNQVELLKDPTAHAEILAITQAAAAVGDWRLNDCDLFVTKEPCPMCAGAAVHARLRRVVFGCEDLRGGAAGGVINLLQMPQLNHRCDINRGVLAQECGELLQEFFRSKRGSNQMTNHE